jgi:hypothetical protein
MAPAYFCHVSFVKMPILCLLKSIVLMMYFESDFLEKKSISFYRNFTNKNDAMGKRTQSTVIQEMLTEATFKQTIYIFSFL